MWRREGEVEDVMSPTGKENRKRIRVESGVCELMDLSEGLESSLNGTPMLK